MLSNDDKLFEKFGREFQSGSIVFSEGDVGNEMYVIQSGKVNITKKSRGGMEKVLITLRPGAFFGEMAIINQKPRSASAVVLEDARLLVVSPKTFESMIRSSSEIAVRMIKIFAQRLQESDEQIENLMIKDNYSRIVHYLMHLASSGTQIKGGVWVDIIPANISVQLGMKPDVVQPIIDRFLRAKLIRIEEKADKKGILIHNVDRLGEFLDFLEMKEKFGNI